MAFTTLNFPVENYVTLNVSASGGNFAYYDGAGSNNLDMPFNYADLESFYTYNPDGSAIIQKNGISFSETKFTGGNGSYAMSSKGNKFFIGRPTSYNSAGVSLSYFSDTFDLGVNYSGVFTGDSVSVAFYPSFNPNGVIYNTNISGLAALLAIDLSSASAGNAYIASIGAANVPILEKIWNPANYISLVTGTFSLASFPDSDGIHTHFVVFASGQTYYTIVDNAGNTVVDYILSSSDVNLNGAFSADWKQTPIGFTMYDPFTLPYVPVLIPGPNGTAPTLKTFVLNPTDSASNSLISGGNILMSFDTLKSGAIVNGTAPSTDTQIYNAIASASFTPQGLIYRERINLPSGNARGLL